MRVIVVAQYLLLGALVAAQWLPWTALLAAAGLPTAWRYLRAARRPRPELRPDGYPEELWPLWFAAMAFVHTRWFGAGLFAGLLLAEPRPADCELHHGRARCRAQRRLTLPGGLAT